MIKYKYFNIKLKSKEEELEELEEKIERELNNKKNKELKNYFLRYHLPPWQILVVTPKRFPRSGEGYSEIAPSRQRKLPLVTEFFHPGLATGRHFPPRHTTGYGVPTARLPSFGYA